jgi:molecular chaperone GrpE
MSEREHEYEIRPEDIADFDDESAADNPAAGSHNDDDDRDGHELSQQLEATRRERDDLSDRVMRLLADYQNLARRGEQNVASARDQQALEMARALVSVLDNFDRALEVDAEKVSGKDLLQGVSMVREEMMRVLGRFGIERLEVAPGEAFDPNRHEAMMRQNAPEIESGHVTQQFQPGYVLRDKTIRPAKVAVAE